MITYDFNGQKHTIMDDELDVVALSGKSNFTAYAHEDPPEPNPFILEKVLMMYFRPGKIEEGERPFCVPDAETTKTWESSRKGIIHLLVWNGSERMSGTQCGVKSTNEAFGRTKFRHMLWHPRACVDCVLAYKISRHEAAL